MVSWGSRTVSGGSELTVLIGPAGEGSTLVQLLSAPAAAVEKREEKKKKKKEKQERTKKKTKTIKQTTKAEPKNM